MLARREPQRGSVHQPGVAAYPPLPRDTVPPHRHNPNGVVSGLGRRRRGRFGPGDVASLPDDTTPSGLDRMGGVDPAPALPHAACCLLSLTPRHQDAKGREASAWAARSAPFPGNAGFQARQTNGQVHGPRPAPCICCGQEVRAPEQCPATARAWTSARKVPRASLPVIFPR